MNFEESILNSLKQYTSTLDALKSLQNKEYPEFYVKSETSQNFLIKQTALALMIKCGDYARAAEFVKQHPETNRVSFAVAKQAPKIPLAGGFLNSDLWEIEHENVGKGQIVTINVKTTGSTDEPKGTNYKNSVESMDVEEMNNSNLIVIGNSISPNLVH